MVVWYHPIVTQPDTKSKPGPDPDRLKIEGDPEEALRKLLKTPPKKAEGDSKETEAEEPEEG